jgi:hypothetical protein
MSRHEPSCDSYFLLLSSCNRRWQSQWNLYVSICIGKWACASVSLALGSYHICYTVIDKDVLRVAEYRAWVIVGSSDWVV